MEGSGRARRQEEVTAFPPEPSPTIPTRCCQHTLVNEKVTRFCLARHLRTSLHINQCNQIPNFAEKVLWTDEACFTREGPFKSRNSHIWNDVNPHGTYVNSYQRKFSVNIWAGIVGTVLLGPVLLLPRLNGETYLAFHENVLPLHMEEVPLLTRQQLWYQHDGAPPHFSLAVRQHLDALYPQRWIGRAGRVHWPARSPDLTPLDFYLWGHVKKIVYATPADTIEELIVRIILAFDEIRETFDFAKIADSMTQRCQKCIEVQGGVFEQLL